MLISTSVTSPCSNFEAFNALRRAKMVPLFLGVFAINSLVVVLGYLLIGI
jgi:hypothetical protein